MLKWCTSSILSVGRFAVGKTYSFPSTFQNSAGSFRFSSILSGSFQRTILKIEPSKDCCNVISKRGVKRVRNDAAEAHRVFRYSKYTGRRTNCNIVPKQFFRLHWGAWIRTMCGRDKRLWRKSTCRVRRLRKHVFCNAQQSKLLDKLVVGWYKKRHYYIDDPYEAYHTRDEFLFTRRTPLPPAEEDFRVDAN